MLRRSLPMGFLIAVCAWLGAPAGAAEGECGCIDENWTGSCEATIRQDGRWIFIESSSQRCSRVEWRASDEPQMTMVGGGEHLLEWKDRRVKKPMLTVERCMVCEAGSERDAPTGASTGSAEEEAETESKQPEAKREEREERSSGRKGSRSDFHGRWVVEGEDVFGAPVPYEMELKVEGREITGSISAGHFEGDSGQAGISGRLLTSTTAEITVHARNWGRTRLTLLDHHTLEMGSGFERVRFRRQ